MSILFNKKVANESELANLIVFKSLNTQDRKIQNQSSEKEFYATE